MLPSSLAAAGLGIKGSNACAEPGEDVPVIASADRSVCSFFPAVAAGALPHRPYQNFQYKSTYPSIVVPIGTFVQIAGCAAVSPHRYGRNSGMSSGYPTRPP